MSVGVYGQMDIFGSTTGTCDCYLLTDELATQAGSIWSPNSIEMTNTFDFTFDINLGDKDADGADGLVFVIRTTPGAPGGSGDGIGYADILNSIGVEVDTWQNGIHGDIANDHMGMNSNGEVDHALIAPIDMGNVEDGMNHLFRVTWDPATMELEVFWDGSSMFVYTGDMVTDFFEGDPEVYFGWTGATGGANNRHVVCSYREVDFTTDHDLGDMITACPGETIAFTDNSTSDLIYDDVDIIEWEWDFGDGESSTMENPTHVYDTPGTYTVTLTVKDITGCFSEITKTVEIGGIGLDITFNQPSCFGFNDGSIVVEVPGGIEDPTFEITDEDDELRNEDNSNAANNLTTGWYYIFVEDDGSGCASALDSIFIDQPEQLGADIITVDPLCYGDSTGYAVVDTVYNAQGDLSNISFFWEPNTFGMEGVGVDSAYNLPAGNYALTINDDNGCSEVIDFTIGQPDELVFAELGFDPAHCRLFNYQNGNGRVFAAASGGTGDYDYLWTYLEDGSTTINSTWGGRNPGAYQITVTDDNGCILTEIIQLDSVSPIASFNVISDQLNNDCKGTADVVVEFENTSQYFSNLLDPGTDTTFLWNLDTANASYSITHDYDFRPDTMYTAQGATYEVIVCLQALNSNGCLDEACKTITIFEPISFVSVNIFTPNNDGVNDIFSFDQYAASISEFNCVIVNRWGVTVGEITDIASGWNGNDLNGSPCKDGVYFYTYEATADDGTLIAGQGTVQLVTGQ